MQAVKIDEKVMVTTSPIEPTADSLSTVLVPAGPVREKLSPPIEFKEATSVTDRDKYLAKFRCS